MKNEETSKRRSLLVSSFIIFHPAFVFSSCHRDADDIAPLADALVGLDVNGLIFPKRTLPGGAGVVRHSVLLRCRTSPNVTNPVMELTADLNEKPSRCQELIPAPSASRVAVEREALDANVPLDFKQVLALPGVIAREPDVGNPAAVHKCALFHGGQSGKRKPRFIR